MGTTNIPGTNNEKGFGNLFESEAVPNSLPVGQNNPQKGPLGLYTEQLSGTSFTTARHLNQKTWLYKTLPSVAQGVLQPVHLESEGNLLG